MIAKAVEQYYISNSNVWWFQSLHMLTNTFYYLSFFIIIILVVVNRYLIVLVFLFPWWLMMLREFSYVCHLCIFLANFIFYLLLIFEGGYLCVYYWVVKVFKIFLIKSLMWFESIFPHYLGSIFIVSTQNITFQSSIYLFFYCLLFWCHM